MRPKRWHESKIFSKAGVGLVWKETHLEFTVTMKPRGKLHHNGRVVELRRSPEPFPVTCVPMSPRCQWPHGGRVSPALLSLATAWPGPDAWPVTNYAQLAPSPTFPPKVYAELSCGGSGPPRISTRGTTWRFSIQERTKAWPSGKSHDMNTMYLDHWVKSFSLLYNIQNEG